MHTKNRTSRYPPKVFNRACKAVLKEIFVLEKLSTVQIKSKRQLTTFTAFTRYTKTTKVSKCDGQIPMAIPRILQNWLLSAPQSHYCLI